jgi:NADH-quinone oxidoreductase subunit F
MELLLYRIENGQGREQDAGLLANIVQHVGGNSLCALGDAACGPVQSLVTTFRDELQLHVREGGCPFPRRRIFGEGAAH